MSTIKQIMLLAGITFLFSGCFQASKQIVIDSYSQPREAAKIRGIKNEDNKESFIALAINPDISTESLNTQPASLDKRVLNSVKEKITQTNFIFLHPFFDMSKNGLNLEITAYRYDKSCDSSGCVLNAEMEISFTITKGVNEYFAKTYLASKTRSAKSRQAHQLPTQNEMVSALADDCAQNFIADISPLKTKQLRSLKPMPKELEYAADYALRGNYRSAIKAMEGYSGDKNAAFYYNLAVMYEALAGKEEDLALLSKAASNYDKAVMSGGNADAVIMKAKGRFDNFYRMFRSINEQQKSNESKEGELNDTFGTSF